MATTINIEVTRNEDGTVNVNETLYAAENALLTLQTQESLQGESIGKHVHAVFDQYFGRKLTIPSLQGYVLNRMMQDESVDASVIMDNYKEWQDAVRLFVRNSNEFDVAKGKGGGAYRLRDVPPKKEGK